MNVAPSYSSRLTTALLQFRNPHGSEENWIAGARTIDNYMIHYGKVLITEIALLALLGLSLGESVVYGTSFAVFGTAHILAMGIHRLTNRHFGFALELCARADFATGVVTRSAVFTWYWNIGNLLIYNIFNTNVMTREPLARIDMVHQNSTMTGRYVTIQIGGTLTYVIGFLAMSSMLLVPAFIRGMSVFLSQITGHLKVEESDLEYRDEFLRNAHIRLNDIIRWGGSGGLSEGELFFNETMVDAPELSKETKQAILETEPEVVNFVLGRAVYLYAFGNKKEAELPSFLKPKTVEQISALRNDPSLTEQVINELKLFMEDPVKFENPDDATKGYEVITPESRVLFMRIKNIAAGELQGGKFFTECWWPSINAYQAAS